MATEVRQIQVRRDTAANWTSENPTLAEGEIGFETDTGKYKIGDGSTAWTSLKYKSVIGKQTIYVPAAAMIAATTNGPSSAQLETATNKINYSVLDFDASTQENVHFQIAFPKSWNEGTILFQVFWSSTATDTDGVSWGLQAVARSDNEAIEQSWGTAQVIDDACQSAAGEVYVSAESSALTIGGSPAAGDLCFFRLYRDVADSNDTAAEDARLIGIKIIYTIDAGNDD
jgi:hypothetical protein